MHENRHPSPVGPLVLIVVFAVAVLTAGWWMPSAVQTVTQLRDKVHAVPTASPDGPDATRAALVDIDTTLSDGEGAGTGIVLDASGDVLTNNHVIEGATGIDAVDVGTGQQYRADVVGYDRTHDLAVVRLAGASGLATAPLGRSADVHPGDPITVMGNAGGQGGAPAQAPGTVTDLDQTITASSEISDDERLTGLIGVNAQVKPGDSGGATVNAAGEVIGVTVAASQDPQVRREGGEGFAIPIDQARAVAQRILSGAGGPSIHLGPTAILGVDVAEDRDSDPAGSLDVADVEPGSPVAAAGVEAGDVITSLDGRAISSQTALSAALAGHRPGDRVRLGWLDAFGAAQHGTVTLTSGPPA